MSSFFFFFFFSFPLFLLFCFSSDMRSNLTSFSASRSSNDSFDKIVCEDLSLFSSSLCAKETDPDPRSENPAREMVKKWLFSFSFIIFTGSNFCRVGECYQHNRGGFQVFFPTQKHKKGGKRKDELTFSLHLRMYSAAFFSCGS